MSAIVMSSLVAVLRSRLFHGWLARDRIDPGSGVAGPRVLIRSTPETAPHEPRSRGGPTSTRPRAAGPDPGPCRRSATRYPGTP